MLADLIGQCVIQMVAGYVRYWIADGKPSALTLDDVRKGGSTADPPAARATYQTFDGLEIELAGRKDGTHSLIAITASSTAKETAAEAEQLAARLSGWEFEIPDYKYNAIFAPLEELLRKPPLPAKKPSSAPKKADAATHPARGDIISK